MKHVGGCSLQRIDILLILGIKLVLLEVGLFVWEWWWLHYPFIELFKLGVMMYFLEQRTDNYLPHTLVLLSMDGEEIVRGFSNIINW